MGRIITLTGASGSGKSTLAGRVLENAPNALMIPSHSTRERRESDVPGEYAYCTREAFFANVAVLAFAWVVQHSGNWYGTLKRDLDACVAMPGVIGMAIVTPSTVPKLRAYLEARGVLGAHTPLYVLNPGESIVRRRLEMRGESRESIARRIESEREWDGIAGVSGVPYVYIRNDGSLEEAYAQLVRAIS